jgi:hypothetical protein
VSVIASQALFFEHSAQRARSARANLIACRGGPYPESARRLACALGRSVSTGTRHDVIADQDFGILKVGPERSLFNSEHSISDDLVDICCAAWNK